MGAISLGAGEVSREAVLSLRIASNLAASLPGSADDSRCRIWASPALSVFAPALPHQPECIHLVVMLAGWKT